MQGFKKEMKKILFHVLEFQIAQGATFWDSQLAPSKFNPWGASGQLLISNTGPILKVYMSILQSHCESHAFYVNGNLPASINFPFNNINAKLY